MCHPFIVSPFPFFLHVLPDTLGGMMSAQRELEDRFQKVGNRLNSPLSAIVELLHLLDQTESFLARVEQSPSESMSKALRPAMKALVAKELLGHSDADVKVVMALWVSEITRITAPDAPYDDNLLKEVFQKIVEAFEKLDLDTVAKVQSCVVMLDFECDALILEIFHYFMCTIRPNHLKNIFNSMETIMTLVLEESDDIPRELLMCLLDTVKINNKDVSPIACRLGEKVMSNCIMKLKPYMKGLVDDSKQSKRTVSDEEDNKYQEIDEVPEGDDENLDLGQECNHLQSDVQSKDEETANNSSRIINETEKAPQDLPLDPVVSTIYPIGSVEASSGSGMPTQNPIAPTLSLPKPSSIFPPVLPSPSTIATRGEVPVKLPFGLFSGPSLIPSPVPAIQIGSIQMPIHLHIQPPVPASYSLNQNPSDCLLKQAPHDSSQGNLGDGIPFIDNKPGLPQKILDPCPETLNSKQPNAL
ncbi:sister chromatid cohesion protein PDS5 homolog B-B-like [Phoenix dactylifera]|uniref:Sister chromatid cohesion protein PDS5 homolog B-B-like n=1 Tax=Phoenix dactylifera TaxID=42345 RepID=A0A8B8J1U8_PHODC|nr:sister chromatid cohesion protein PDS5 homolog B-B-like [Phoenix dactylifera]